MSRTMQHLFIICFLISFGIMMFAEAETECDNDVLEEIQDSEDDFRYLSTNLSCPEHFQVCFLPDVQNISIGDKVSSLCRLHTSTSHADSLVISYHTGGESFNITVDLTVCHKVQSSMFPFDLVVVRPNNINSDREARIYILNVRQKTTLEALCTARQRNGLKMVPVACNTLTIEFILNSTGPSIDLTTDLATDMATEPPIDVGLAAGLGAGLGALVIVVIAALFILLIIYKRKTKSKPHATAKR